MADMRTNDRTNERNVGEVHTATAQLHPVPGARQLGVHYYLSRMGSWQHTLATRCWITGSDGTLRLPGPIQDPSGLPSAPIESLLGASHRHGTTGKAQTDRQTGGLADRQTQAFSASEAATCMYSTYSTVLLIPAAFE